MIQVYKIMKGQERLDKNDFFIPASTTTRGHDQKLYKQSFRLDVRRNSFSQRIINDWNSLPMSVVNEESLDRFKARLDKFWSEELFKY